MALTPRSAVKPKSKSQANPKQLTLSNTISNNGNAHPPISFSTLATTSGNQLEKIEQLQRQLWEAADELRANSKLTANE
jgi:hypothetical protein